MRCLTLHLCNSLSQLVNITCPFSSKHAHLHGISIFYVPQLSIFQNYTMVCTKLSLFFFLMLTTHVDSIGGFSRFMVCSSKYLSLIQKTNLWDIFWKLTCGCGLCWAFLLLWRGLIGCGLVTHVCVSLCYYLTKRNNV